MTDEAIASQPDTASDCFRRLAVQVRRCQGVMRASSACRRLPALQATGRGDGAATAYARRGPDVDRVSDWDGEACVHKSGSSLFSVE